MYFPLLLRVLRFIHYVIHQPSLCSPQLHIHRGICKAEPFGKLHKPYLLWYIVVAELIGRDEDLSLLFCQTAERRVKREFRIRK